MKQWKLAMCASAAALVMGGAALAEDQPAAPAAAPAAPAAPTFSLGMNGPIVINPTPYTTDAGPLGNITINGAVSGLVLAQNHHATGDHSGDGDFTNAQILIEKTDGVFQYFLDVGSYSFPTIGTPYTKANHAVTSTFGNVPMGYVKIVPNSAFSIEVGKLPTLIGSEYNFTFENFNIERGLLWNQENLVNRGVQVNYTAGPLALSVSVNDGFYSNKFDWVSGLATWTINSSNILAFAAGGNTSKSYVSNSATPVLNNNSQIYNLIYTHTDGPWTVVPYLQYTTVPSLSRIGTTSGSTTGAALFVNYTFPSTAKLGDTSLAGLSIPVRLEYISTKGNASSGPNLLYGPGSKAASFTITPTYQYKIYFIRGELSYVSVDHATSGLALGTDGTAKSQTRAMIETGVLF